MTLRVMTDGLRAGDDAAAWQNETMQEPPALLRVHGDPTVAIDPVAVGRIVEEIFPEALGGWIYGSFAHGRARRDSDLDIAILRTDPLIPGKRTERALDVGARSPTATWISR